MSKISLELLTEVLHLSQLRRFKKTVRCIGTVPADDHYSMYIHCSA
jgi:hypothetical protein